jgi:hypothetical protein
MGLHLPVACSLDARAARSREEEWKALIASYIIERNEVPNGVRLTLRRSDQAIADVKRLVELERGCCAWIDWTLDDAGSYVYLEASAATEEGVGVLRSWLCSGHLTFDAPVTS